MRYLILLIFFTSFAQAAESELSQEYYRLYSKLKDDDTLTIFHGIIIEVFKFQNKEKKVINSNNDYSLKLYLAYLDTLDVKYDPAWTRPPFYDQSNKQVVRTIGEQLTIRQCEKDWYDTIIQQMKGYIKQKSKKDEDLITLIDKEITNKTRQDQIKKSLGIAARAAKKRIEARIKE